jgi:hypothetical protein
MGFGDDLMEDIADLEVSETGKRTLTEADMDVDEETVPKRRR